MRRHNGWVGEFAKFKNRHRGQKLIVCGTGPSIRQFNPPPHIVTIGVNDIGKYFTPTYLIVLDQPLSFKDGRCDTILRTKSQAVFVPHWTALKWQQAGLEFTKYPLRRVNRKNKVEPWEDPHSGLPQIHFKGSGSTYAALSLAGYMGARKIGMIGVDLGDHKAFKKRLDDMKADYGAIVEFLASKGSRVFNLSPESALTNIEPRELSLFCGPSGSGGSL